MEPSERAWFRLADVVRGDVPSTHWAVTAAEMLAAHRLLPQTAPGSIGDATSEFTPQHWERVRDDAMRVWMETNVRDGATPPFAQRLGDARWPPGYFESVRSAVLEATKVSAASHAFQGSLEPVLTLLAMVSRMRHWDMPPVYLGELLAEVVGEPTPRSAYCAFEGAGVAALILGHRGVDVVYEVRSADLASFFSALSVSGRCKMSVVVGDPTAPAHDELREADVSIFVPPFGQSGVRDFDVAMQVSHRKTVCAVLNGTLFRSAVADQAAKERLLAQGLSAVVALPPGSMSTMSRIPGALLVIERPRASREVLMVDGTATKRGQGLEAQEDREQLLRLIRQRDDGGSSAIVWPDEIAANDFNLLPERYVLPAHLASLYRRLATEPTASLGDLVEIYRPQPSPKGDEPDTDWGWAEIAELVVSDLTEVGTAPPPRKRFRVSPSDALRMRKAELAEGDVLLVTKGSVGKVGLVRSIPPGETWVANQSFAILRLRGSGPIRDPRVLFRYLSSSVGQELLQAVRVGSTIPSIQMADLRRVQVLIPSEAEQDSVARAVEQLFDLEAQIDRIRQMQAGLQAETWPEIEQ